MSKRKERVAKTDTAFTYFSSGWMMGAVSFIEILDGTTLIYQITGQIDLDDSGRQTHPTEADSTVYRAC